MGKAPHRRLVRPSTVASLPSSGAKIFLALPPPQPHRKDDDNDDDDDDSIHTPSLIVSFDRDPIMYCGDETGAYIGDVGTHVSRFGYGGEDNPKHVVPSYVANNGNSNDDQKQRYVPRSCLRQHFGVSSVWRRVQTPPSAPQVDPEAFLWQGDVVEDWDAYETLWQDSFRALRVKDPLKHTTGGKGNTVSNTTASDKASSSTAGGTASLSEQESLDGPCVHPILAVDPGCASNRDKEKQIQRQTEILMESLQAPACFVAPAPMLAAFSHGRQTCLVVDVGSSGTRVTPVVDGFVLNHSQRRNGRGGDWLSNVAWKACLDHYANHSDCDQRFLPRYQTRRKPMSLSTTTTTTTNTTGPLHVQTDSLESSPTKPNAKKRKTTEEGTASSTTPSDSAVDNRADCPIFHRWAMHELFAEMRTIEQVALEPFRTDDYKTPFVAKAATEPTDSNETPDRDNDPMETDETRPEPYELPDGTTIDLQSSLGKDLLRIPELLFTDDVPFQTNNNNNNNNNNSSKTGDTSTASTKHPTVSNLSIHRLIHESVSSVGDADLRKELCGNIVLVGGSSLFPGMEQRLSYELSGLITANFKCRVLASRFAVERSCASWIGASVLTSLGSFQQLWLSKEEYAEYGAALSTRRFP